MIQRIMLSLLCGLSLGGASGCFGPDNVASVSGTVKLNGQPLPSARVIFNPQVAGGESSAITDDAGKYVLQYTREVKGAEIGEHKVRITTASKGDPDANPPQPKRPELLPAKYHSKSELTATVQSGSNVIDFDLQVSEDEMKKKSR